MQVYKVYLLPEVLDFQAALQTFVLILLPLKKEQSFEFFWDSNMIIYPPTHKPVVHPLSDNPYSNQKG